MECDVSSEFPRTDAENEKPVGWSLRGAATDPARAEPDGIDSMILSIVVALEEQTEIDPADSSFELYEYIDPAALQQLCEHARGRDTASWTFEFQIEDVVVAIESDGSIAVE